MKIFSKEEIKDLLLSVVFLTLIFSFKPIPEIGINYKMIPQYLAVVVIAFLFHELAHKFVAMRFGCMAIYKIWPNGILFGLALMLVGIRFAAPGAVVIYPYFFGRWGYRVKTLTVNENGITAMSGPAVNLFFGILFSIFEGNFFGMLAAINAWIAFINLLPLPPLDGSKIMEWRIWVWGLMIGLSLILLIISWQHLS